YLEGVPDGACVIVEIHAEATSEKVALGWYANATGRVAAVVGTHTHVPTADARVLPKPGTDVSLPGSPNPFPGGTAYVTDLGMTGPDDSVLGRRVDRVLTFMTTVTPAPFDVAEGRPAAHGVLIDVDERTGRASGIERFDLVMPIDA
ncbi:MAG: YmdB family metallophosphoesterase, partial [Planctomycetota bacterium]